MAVVLMMLMMYGVPVMACRPVIRRQERALQ